MTLMRAKRWFDYCDCDCVGVSRQNDASRRLSQPKLTPTAISRHSSQSSVNSNEDTMPTGLTISKLNRQLSQHTSNACSTGGTDVHAQKSPDSTARVHQQQPAAQESRRTTENKRVPRATDNVRGTTTPQTTQTGMKKPVAAHQKTTLVSGSSTRLKQAVTRQPQPAANSRSSLCNDEITIAVHKPTVSVSACRTGSATNNRDKNLRK